MEARDMPKLYSPFVRAMVNGRYVVTPAIDEEYRWVFEDENVIATEKLDGTNVSIIIENGEIKEIWNRTEKIPFFNKGKRRLVEGVYEAFSRGYLDKLGDGQHFGECIGEGINGNPLHVEGTVWIPFETYAREHLVYKSWGKYPKDFQTISDWFKNDIFSLYIRQHTGLVEKPEGVVFYLIDKSTNKITKMAKLRRDMFDWYEGPRHKDDKRVHVEEVKV